MRRLRRWRGQTVLDEVAAPSRKSILGCIEGYRFVEEVVIIVWSVMLIFLVDRGLGADDGCRTVLDGVPCHNSHRRSCQKIFTFQSFREGGVIIGEFMYEVFSGLTIGNYFKACLGGDSWVLRDLKERLPPAFGLCNGAVHCGFSLYWGAYEYA